MLNLSLNIQISNIINLIFGIVIGFFIMIMLTCAFLSFILKRNNKNEKIREISHKAYNEKYNTSSVAKDKIISSLIYEVKEVSSLIHHDKKNPHYELSINDIINGINIIHRKLKKVVDHPLCSDIKNIHISTLLTIEEKIAKPVLKVSKRKSFKFLYKVYSIVIGIINLINPIFYIRKITNYFVLRKGKKDIIIICLDFVGNTTYEIYSSENNLQK